MLAHFNKMNTLLLFYRKMGNTLFLEQDEYIVVVFRKDEKYFISLIAKWACSYHFTKKKVQITFVRISFYILIYIILIPDAFKDVRGIWWICSLHSESNFRWFGIFPSNTKNIRGKKALSLAAQKTKETSPKKAKGTNPSQFP